MVPFFLPILPVRTCFERVKCEYQKRKSASQNKNAKFGKQASADNRTRVNKQATSKNLA
jgi:hypothetical protein